MRADFGKKYRKSANKDPSKIIIGPLTINISKSLQCSFF